MLKTVAFILVISLSVVTAVRGQKSRFSFSSGGAVNVNDFNWSIAGNQEGNSPNVLSELIFNDITSAGYFFEGTFRPQKHLEIMAYYQRNNTINGQGTDTDYSGDNRSDPSFHQDFSSNRGHLQIFRIGARYDFLDRDKFRLGAGASYGFTLQNFVILRREEMDLKSTYRAHWQGPAVSLAGTYKINQQFSVDGDFTYAFKKYKAEANWNLIDIFKHPVSFAQRSNGWSMDFDMKFCYKLNSSLSFFLDGLIGKAKALKGTDTSYLRNDTQISTQFNGSNDDYYGAKLGVALLF